MVSPRVWSISGRRVCLVGGHFLQNFSRDVFNRHPVAIYRRMHSIEIFLFQEFLQLFMDKRMSMILSSCEISFFFSLSQ